MHAQIATQPGSPDTANEDSTAVGDNTLVLLDGATERTDSGCVHGVAWFAQHLAEAIKKHADIGPEGALAEAIARTADLHRDTCDLTHPGTPSAAVAIIHIDADALHYLVLGDVTVVIDTTTGLEIISDQRISHTASTERAAADALPDNHPAKPQALVRMKHAELAARNTPGGYWIAATEPDAAQHALTGHIPLAQVRRAAALTDGAARAVDPFKLHDWPDILTLLEESGPAELIHQVRATEALDPQATRWPRNKISDDATAAYLPLDQPKDRPGPGLHRHQDRGHP
ncbi:protein phosphatase 2C domain-containing protein [Myceligenerans halotolerans]